MTEPAQAAGPAAEQGAGQMAGPATPPPAAAVALRSWLYVPGGRPERFAKALASGADAVILDLEDGVAAGARAQAIAQVDAFLAAPAPGARAPQLWVRVDDARVRDARVQALARHAERVLQAALGHAQVGGRLGVEVQVVAGHLARVHALHPAAHHRKERPIESHLGRATAGGAARGGGC